MSYQTIHAKLLFARCIRKQASSLETLEWKWEQDLASVISWAIASVIFCRLSETFDRRVVQIVQWLLNGSREFSRVSNENGVAYRSKYRWDEVLNKFWWQQ